MRTTRSVVLLFLATACVPPAAARFVVARPPVAPLAGEREIVIAGERGEVERRLDEALRDLGFRVKRIARTGGLAREIPERQVASIEVPITRYVIVYLGEIDLKCRGGGFHFKSLRVDVTDLRMNEVVMSGGANDVYSEGCPTYRDGLASKDPTDDGTLFGDIAKAIAGAWDRAPGPAPTTEKPASGPKSPNESI